MKDKLPKGWEWKKLGEVGDVCMCKRIVKKQTLPTGDIPFYKIGTFGKNPDAYISKEIYQEYKSKYSFPKKGDILLSASGTIGRRVIYDGEPAYFQDSNIVWISNDEKKVTNNYLYMFYSFCDWNPTVGATISRLYNNNLRSIEIPLPSIPEQKQIVSVLDKTFEKLDQAIALVEENIQKLKQLNDSVLDKVFSLKNKKNVKTLIEVCDVITDGTHHTPKYEENGIIFLSSKNVTKGVINWDDVKYVSEELHKQLQKRVSPKKDDILLAKNGTTGISAIVDRDIEFDIYVSLALLRPTIKKIIPKYLLYFINSPVAKSQFNSRLKGVGVPNLHLREIKEVQIPIIDFQNQQLIVAYLDQITEKNNQLIQHHQNKLEALKRLKNSVLDSAFKGELRRTKIVSISQPVIDPYFAKTKKIYAKKNADKQAMVIALAIESHEKTGKSLYRTKGEKTVEVIEKNLNLDFGREPIKMTAGPADFIHLVNVVEPLAKERKWFYTQEIKGENYDGHKYIKAENFNPFMMRCVQDLKQNLDEIRRIVNLFTNFKTTHEAEVVATTYSGWNNLIIRDSQIDDEAIVTEARENWHEAKLKIDRQEFFNAIVWLKNNNLVPQGNGKEVKG